MASSTTAAEFEPVHFAEGRFRRAYKGRWLLPEKYGKKCVIKEMKNSYTWAISDWDMTVKVYDRARQLSTVFNSSVSPGYPINVTEVGVYRVSKSASSTGPSVNEYVVAEEYLDGTFVKWCNNYGHISQQAKDTNITMPAFVHWSWLYTRGREMVADLQGVRDENGYHLTDPVILSVDNSYGSTDMGIEGMAMFFLNHQCNDICRGWKRPNLFDFKGQIPQATLYACQTMQGQVNNATTFTFELQFPQAIKQIVARVFLQIAAQ